MLGSRPYSHKDRKKCARMALHRVRSEGNAQAFVYLLLRGAQFLLHGLGT
jgi:hypothetical protein